MFVFSFSDVVCGQIQCTDDSRTKPVVDYGYSYKVVSLASGKKCRYDQSMPSVEELVTSAVIESAMNVWYKIWMLV